MRGIGVFRHCLRCVVILQAILVQHTVPSWCSIDHVSISVRITLRCKRLSIPSSKRRLSWTLVPSPKLIDERKPSLSAVSSAMSTNVECRKLEHYPHHCPPLTSHLAEPKLLGSEYCDYFGCLAGFPKIWNLLDRYSAHNCAN